MKIRAQIGMVLNLDKCIGCHTQRDLQNVDQPAGRRVRPGSTTSRPSPASAIQGMGESAALERRLGAQGRGRIVPRQGGKWQLLMKIFANPNLPEIDDYYEPFTFDYDHLHSAPEMQHQPTVSSAQPDHGPAHGEDRMGAELGGNPGRGVREALQDKNFEEIEKDIYGQFENTFMMYLPRLCEHCLNPSCVASCPSGSIYKREEDGIVLIDQTNAVVGDVRLGLSVQEDLLQLEKRQGGEVHLLLSAYRSGPADGLFGDLRRTHSLSRRCCTTPTASRARRASSAIAISTRRSSTSSSTRPTPR